MLCIKNEISNYENYTKQNKVMKIKLLKYDTMRNFDWR